MRLPVPEEPLPEPAFHLAGSSDIHLLVVGSLVVVATRRVVWNGRQVHPEHVAELAGQRFVVVPVLVCQVDPDLLGGIGQPTLDLCLRFLAEPMQCQCVTVLLLCPEHREVDALCLCGGDRFCVHQRRPLYCQVLFLAVGIKRHEVILKLRDLSGGKPKRLEGSGVTHRLNGHLDLRDLDGLPVEGDIPHRAHVPQGALCLDPLLAGGFL